MKCKSTEEEKSWGGGLFGRGAADPTSAKNFSPFQNLSLFGTPIQKPHLFDNRRSIKEKQPN